MGDDFLSIVLFAMLAAFLVFKLRSVLGKRTGHERPRQEIVALGTQQPSPDDRRQQDRDQRGRQADSVTDRDKRGDFCQGNNDENEQEDHALLLFVDQRPILSAAAVYRFDTAVTVQRRDFNPDL